MYLLTFVAHLVSVEFYPFTVRYCLVFLLPPMAHYKVKGFFYKLVRCDLTVFF